MHFDNKQLNAELIARASERLFQMQFRVERINESIMKKVVEIALLYKRTVYDASHVAFAQLYGIPLITADKKLSKIPNVLMIDKI
ncbi:MAG TPA: type II toxin-antitoxin system VapC family toxin [Candidatus Nanoarchaeia archaeon]|nr:type II toxin-antitoxin system VapC family toxin [Candidatus Nanoarchaeia archaeon]